MNLKIWFLIALWPISVFGKKPSCYPTSIKETDTGITVQQCGRGMLGNICSEKSFSWSAMSGMLANRLAAQDSAYMLYQICQTGSVPARILSHGGRTIISALANNEAIRKRLESLTSKPVKKLEQEIDACQSITQGLKKLQPFPSDLDQTQAKGLRYAVERFMMKDSRSPKGQFRALQMKNDIGACATQEEYESLVIKLTESQNQESHLLETDAAIQNSDLCAMKGGGIMARIYCSLSGSKTRKGQTVAARNHVQ